MSIHHMRRRFRLASRVLAASAAATALVFAGTAALTGSASAAPVRAGVSCTHNLAGPTKIGRFSGIARPMTTKCSAPRQFGDPAVGNPPLINHGGPVMSTAANAKKVVVTPIFWSPADHPMPTAYQALLTRYLHDLGAATGSRSNVFATDAEYAGSNGQIVNNLTAGTAITDTHALPANGCTVNAGSVYADGTGYNKCLDDAQIIAETQAVITANALPTNLGHMYVMFTPKAVESCFYPGNPANQACTINSSPSAAYCAYHSSFGASGQSIYAEMPFPIYQSATGFSCTDEGLGGGIQHPNGNTDGDVEISPTSHEMAESITDPNGNAWYDVSGYENGDECAYVYGTLQGAAGVHFNQIVAGHHYLTQEEFSNADFNATGGGCLQGLAPKILSITPNNGPHAGGTSVTIMGSGFNRTSAVKFGTTPAASFTFVNDRKLTAVTPAHTAGVVNVFITSPYGTSKAILADRYTFN